MSTFDISVIIATRHREQILWETVEKTGKVLENTNAELIIINDGDSPLQVPARLPDNISYFDNPKKGVSSARNAGAARATGTALFFVDDDMWITKEAIDWINRNVIENNTTEAVYFINWEYPPYLKEMLRSTKIGRYLLDTDYNTLWGRLHKNFPKPLSGLYQHDCIGSGSLVMHKNIFERAGGYNEKITFQGEDDDLAGRLNAMGIPIFIVFDITLYHNHRDRLEINNFLKRTFDGFGSEFKAVTAGEINPVNVTGYKGAKRQLLEFSRKTEKGWIFLFNLLPNRRFMTPITNKLIGALGGLQKYKQWKKNIG